MTSITHSFYSILFYDCLYTHLHGKGTEGARYDSHVLLHHYAVPHLSTHWMGLAIFLYICAPMISQCSMYSKRAIFIHLTPYEYRETLMQLGLFWMQDLV
ncbi:d9bdb1ba-cb1f-48b1-b1fe-6498406361ab [Sclerotinia trifoliorum]|uniref:D9bdb1ba-cb1f-48b1-b1fe-6498406361ab n=1 Tax=Sclerotinia trifoliorum TaxID=28548 RepID=A0A8H2VMQ9_9HELO|nr:d9bdb1ba-cb1f-48b1-b1fe-6498406361ab [Sclerotinia trifoliorum]